MFWYFIYTSLVVLALASFGALIVNLIERELDNEGRP